jgi:hypothetical protein
VLVENLSQQKTRRSRSNDSDLRALTHWCFSFTSPKQLA